MDDGVDEPNLPMREGRQEVPLLLSNDAKIKACNFYHAMQCHMGCCDQCCEYLYQGDGDLCLQGKAIIAKHLAYVDTSPDLSANE